MKRFSVYFKRSEWVEINFEDYSECVSFYNFIRHTLNVSSVFMVDHEESLSW